MSEILYSMGILQLATLLLLVVPVLQGVEHGVN